MIAEKVDCSQRINEQNEIKLNVPINVNYLIGRVDLNIICETSI